jgi:hypothetical protein
VIVASILLAFAVDAWWDRQGEREDETEVLLAVESEFIAYRDVLRLSAELTEGLVENTEMLLDSLRTVRPGEPVTVSEALLRSVIEWPTLRIPVSTVEPAGVVDPELGSLLRQWQAEVRTSVGRYDSARELVFGEIRPLLAQDVDIVKLDRQVAAFFIDEVEPDEGSMQVSRTPDLEAALSGRASLLYGALLGITRLNGWLSDIEAQLNVALGR